MYEAAPGNDRYQKSEGTSQEAGAAMSGAGRLTEHELAQILTHPYDYACVELLGHIAALEAEIAALQHRLEVDRAYKPDGSEIVIPPDQRGKFPDGISCRDATIELMEEAVAKKDAQIAHLEKVLASFQDRNIEGTHLIAQLRDENDKLIAANKALNKDIGELQNELHHARGR